MNSIKCIFMIIILFILVIPLFTMWIVSIILESCAKLLDNIVGTVGDWFEKQLGGYINNIYE